jgi:transporter family-2 protein
MEEIGAAWLYPIIIIAGALQAWGPPMNGALRNALTNPWLASVVSFLPVVALLTCLFLCAPRPLPTAEGVGAMPWWAPLGGLVGAFAVIAGLLFVTKVGAGAFAGLTITANILMSLLIDKFKMVRVGGSSLERRPHRRRHAHGHRDRSYLEILSVRR